METYRSNPARRWVLSPHGGTAAEEDLRGIKAEYDKKGVKLIAAAIGEDKENIERIYGESFLDITNLDELHITLVDKIKRYLKD